MLVRLLLAVAMISTLSPRSLGGTMHPQDGPHADLRVAIEDDLVRFSVGVNLAFLDEASKVPREALGELNADEAEQNLEAFRTLLDARATCVINGEPIRPTFERLEIFTDPDPGMIAVFPKMGNRALIRATAVLRFDAPAMTETVEITWPTYPIDQLAEQLESTSGARPHMYFEAVFTAGGKSSAARFTHAEPTIRWTRTESSPADLLTDLPSPAFIDTSASIPFRYLLLAAIGTAAIGIGAAHRSVRVKATAFGTVLVLLAVGIAIPKHNTNHSIISEPQAREVLLLLHETMYRAFDYTAESDVYDRLGLALEGDLLGDLYEQLRLSLLQAEEEMKVGVVTGLDPIETTITSIDPPDRSALGRGFNATHRWRVDGTVYHWGHSHTRAHIYEAAYRVVYTDTGWRITQHRLLSQLRIDPSKGVPFDQMDPNQRALDLLGKPDI